VSKPFEPLAINLRNTKQPSDGSNGCSANSLLKEAQNRFERQGVPPLRSGNSEKVRKSMSFHV
jgi:hypothetical protein